MEDELVVAWRVADGYHGNANHYLRIYREELEGLSLEEVMDDIEDIVGEEFRQVVTWELAEDPAEMRDRVAEFLKQSPASQ